MHKPPIPLAITETQPDEPQQQQRKRKILRACLILAVLVPALWAIAAIGYYSMIDVPDLAVA